MPESPTQTRRKPRISKKALTEIAIVLLALIALTGVHMWPSLTDCNETIMGGPGDATSGGVWQNWQWEINDAGPWPARTNYVNAPYGQELWQPVQLTSLAVQLPMWLFTRMTGPVCGWNLTVALGFIVCGITMYGFAKWLTASREAAAFGAYAFAFSPYHAYKAYGHVDFVHSYVLVLVICSFLFLWRRPTPKRGALAGLALAACFYTNGYYILLGTVTAASSFVLGFIFIWRRNADRNAKLLLRSLVVASIVFLLAVIPVGAVFTLQRQEVLNTTAANRSSADSEVDTYSARPHEFILPPRTHPVFSPLFGRYQDTHLHNSNFSEQTLYLGWTVIGFSAIAVFSATRRGRSLDKDELPIGLSRRGVALTLAGVAAVGVVFSTPADIHIAGERIVTLTGLIYEQVQLWRVFARFFLAIHAALVLLAAIGIAWLVRSKPMRLRAILTTVLILLVGFEFLTYPPYAAWSYEEAPAHYKWLARQPDIRTIAEYPLWVPPQNEALEYVSYQIVHGKRLMNTPSATMPQQPIREGIVGVGDPQTLGVLRALKIDALVVHLQHLDKSRLDPPPNGLTLLKGFAKARVYRVQNGERASVAAGVVTGFHHPELDGWRSRRWMDTRAQLKLFSVSGNHRLAQLHFHAFSTIPRVLTIRQNGRVIWEGSVTDTDVVLNAAVGPSIELSTSPGARQEGGDPRKLAVLITELRASALSQ